MKIIFKRTKYKNESVHEVLTEIVELPDDFTTKNIKEIGERLLIWSEDKGEGDYDWDYEGEKNEWVK